MDAPHILAVLFFVAGFMRIYLAFRTDCDMDACDCQKKLKPGRDYDERGTYED